MDLRDRPEDVAFRREVRGFLDDHLVGEFAELGGRGGSGDETFGFEVRRRWERVLAEGGWTCLGWPAEFGGRGATMTEQVIFNERPGFNVLLRPIWKAPGGTAETLPLERLIPSPPAGRPRCRSPWRTQPASACSRWPESVWRRISEPPVRQARPTRRPSPSEASCR